MVRGHWLDPIAVNILLATGCLQRPKKSKDSNANFFKYKAVEKELQILKEKQLQESCSNFFLIDVNRAKMHE